MEAINIKNVEIGKDLKGFLSANYEDIIINDEIKQEIMDLNNDDLVLVEKQINSPTKIVSVTLINETLIDEIFE
jgi:hypothetical protein